ncbi:MAG: flavin reductase family protein [Bacteroidota bacterium]
MEKKALEKALHAFPYGLYVVGSRNGKSVSTIVANWATQVSFNPPLVAIAIENDSQMKDHIDQSGVFSLNILPAGGTETAKAFVRSTKPIGNMINGRSFHLSQLGTPFLGDASASIECKVINTMPTGDHTTYIGEAVDAILHLDGDALTLKETGWRYQRSPKTKPPTK